MPAFCRGHRAPDSRPLGSKAVFQRTAGARPRRFFRGPAWPAAVWGAAILSGAFLASYFFFMMLGYRSGHFSVVYPISRAIPVLLLCFFDSARGNVPSLLGWTGITLVLAGCALSPHRSLRQIEWGSYWNRNSLWILLTALSITGYSAVDKVAAEHLPAVGAGSAAVYLVVEFTFTVPGLALLLWCLPRSKSNRKARGAGGTSVLLAAVLNFGAYWLILWAFQLSDHASTIAGLRQFSIVIGVVVAVIVFREPARGLRIAAAILITLGVMAIGVAEGA